MLDHSSSIDCPEYAFEMHVQYSCGFNSCLSLSAAPVGTYNNTELFTVTSLFKNIHLSLLIFCTLSSLALTLNMNLPYLRGLKSSLLLLVIPLLPSVASFSVVIHGFKTNFSLRKKVDYCAVYKECLLSAFELNRPVFAKLSKGIR